MLELSYTLCLRCHVTLELALLYRKVLALRGPHSHHLLLAGQAGAQVMNVWVISPSSSSSSSSSGRRRRRLPPAVAAHGHRRRRAGCVAALSARQLGPKAIVLLFGVLQLLHERHVVVGAAARRHGTDGREGGVYDRRACSTRQSGRR